MYEKTVSIEPAYDLRSKEPGKNYGVHCCELRFTVKGKSGAVDFVVYTGWHLPNVLAGFKQDCTPETMGTILSPMGVAIGIHSHKPRDGIKKVSNACEILGGECYYDAGSALRAGEWMQRLIAEGSGWLWEALVKEYEDTFGAD